MKHRSLLMLLTILPAFGFTPAPEAAKGFTFEVAGKGRVTIQVNSQGAPLASERILNLVAEGFYDSQRFHKVVRSPKPFLVQVGDPASKTGDIQRSGMGTTQTGAKIRYENSGMKAVRGTVGLSRLESSKDTGDSQFFILLDNFGFLEGQYTLFGTVTQGMDVVDQIELGDRITRAELIN